jgi:hypothetical protein
MYRKKSLRMAFRLEATHLTLWRASMFMRYLQSVFAYLSLQWATDSIASFFAAPELGSLSVVMLKGICPWAD